MRHSDRYGQIAICQLKFLATRPMYLKFELAFKFTLTLKPGFHLFAVANNDTANTGIVFGTFVSKWKQNANVSILLATTNHEVSLETRFAFVSPFRVSPGSKRE